MSAVESTDVQVALTEVEKSQILKTTSLVYRQTRKIVMALLWLLVIVIIIGYIFAIWGSVAMINVLQTASPTDPFKENNSTNQLYKNLAIGTVVMSTIGLILVFFLVGAFYTYFNSMRRMFQVVKTSPVPSQENIIHVPSSSITTTPSPTTRTMDPFG